MRRKVAIVIGVVILILLLIIVAVLLCKKEELDGYDQAAQGLNVEFNADIIVYGEEPNFRDTVEYRRIDVINEENLYSGNEHGYKAIVLYDREGTMKVTDEELLLIRKYVEKNAYDMIYIGRNYLDDFERLGFTVGMWDDAYSFEYIGSIHEGKEVQQNEYGNLYAQHGLWTGAEEEQFKYEKDRVQSRIIRIMYDYAREAAGVEF